MEKKVNKILNSIKPTRREKLSKQREVRLSLIDDLKEHTETLEDLEYGESFETIDSVAKELGDALQNAKNLDSLYLFGSVDLRLSNSVSSMV